MNPQDGEVVPRARTEPYSLWDAARQLLVTEAIRAYQGRVDVAFLGDSITGGWRWDASWKTVFGSRKLLNLGLGGDTTSHLLWRLEQGLVDGLDVKQAIVLIGINDCWHAPSAEFVRRGVEACLARTRRGLPQARLTLYGIFPLRGEGTRLNPLIMEVNGGLEAVASRYAAAFRDIGREFFEGEREVSQRLMPDGCHFSPEAYAIWGRDVANALL